MNKLTLFFFFVFCVGFAAHAQVERVLNLPDFDKKKLHFGFSLCVNTMDYRMRTNLTNPDSLIKLEADPQSGFNIGIVSSFNFNPYFSVRFLPSLSFGQRNLEYTFADEPRNRQTIKMVESTYLDFPLNLKYRSARLNNFAAYVIGGGRYSIDLSSQRDIDNNLPPDLQVVRLDRDNVWYEVGFGLDFFLEYFKFSTELKLSMGLHNVLIQDYSIWSTPIGGIRPRMITISFHFEG
jgi:hypothetical protein